MYETLLEELDFITTRLDILDMQYRIHNAYQQGDLTDAEHITLSNELYELSFRILY